MYIALRKNEKQISFLVKMKHDSQCEKRKNARWVRLCYVNLKLCLFLA